MGHYHFDRALPGLVAIEGSDRPYAVRRIFCAARNYTKKSKPPDDRSQPLFFMKPGDCLVSNGKLAYPLGTSDLQPEVELVLALGGGGRNLSPQQAQQCIYGCAVGNDLVKRDLQATLQEAGNPWEISKSFDGSAQVGPLRPGSPEQLGNAELWLDIDGIRYQAGTLDEMIWKPAELVSQLSRFFELRQGDLVFTGSPGGTAKLQQGTLTTAGITGLTSIHLEIC